MMIENISHLLLYFVSNIVCLFSRLCYVKLKLLLIAIEFKSEQRESRFVKWIFLSHFCGNSKLLRVLFQVVITGLKKYILWSVFRLNNSVYYETLGNSDKNSTILEKIFLPLEPSQILSHCNHRRHCILLGFHAKD